MVEQVKTNEVAIMSTIDLLHAQKAFHHHAGADQEDHRDGHFRDKQQVVQALPAGARRGRDWHASNDRLTLPIWRQAIRGLSPSDRTPGVQ